MQLKLFRQRLFLIPLVWLQQDVLGRPFVNLTHVQQIFFWRLFTCSMRENIRKLFRLQLIPNLSLIQYKWGHPRFWLFWALAGCANLAHQAFPLKRIFSWGQTHDQRVQVKGASALFSVQFFLMLYQRVRLFFIDFDLIRDFTCFEGGIWGFGCDRLLFFLLIMNFAAGLDESISWVP